MSSLSGSRYGVYTQLSVIGPSYALSDLQGCHGVANDEIRISKEPPSQYRRILGGQASALGGLVQIYSAQNAAFLNSINDYALAPELDAWLQSRREHLTREPDEKEILVQSLNFFGQECVGYGSSTRVAVWVAPTGVLFQAAHTAAILFCRRQF